jgi:hypothetical protein
MKPMSKRLVFRVSEVDREIKDKGRHVGWERVQEVHRVVIKSDSGREIITSDTVVSTDPDDFQRRNPKVVLEGVRLTPNVDSVRDFLAAATPDQLAELGLDTGGLPLHGVTTAPLDKDTPEDDEPEDAEPGDPDRDIEYPFHLGEDKYALSDGSTFEGTLEEAEDAEIEIEIEEDEDAETEA